MPKMNLNELEKNFSGDNEFFQEIEDFRQELSELYEHERQGDLSDNDQIRLNEWKVELMS